MTNYRINCMCYGQTLRSYQKIQSKEYGVMKTKWIAIGYYCNKCMRFYSNGFIKWIINFKRDVDYKTITIHSFYYKEYIETFIELQRLASILAYKLTDIRKKHSRNFLDYFAKSFFIKSLNKFKKF